MVMGCNNTQTNNASSDADSVYVQNDEQIDNTIKTFIAVMYDMELYSDYEFLEKHCTKKLLKKLADDYDYDHEPGEKVYAVWDFRTSSNDGKPGSEDNRSCVIGVTPDGDGWYTYEFLDGGWKGKNRVKCSLVDDEVMMDDVERVYDEARETYNAE